MNPAVEYVGRVLDDPACTLSTPARFVLAEHARHWNRRSQTSWIGQGRVNDDGTKTGLMKTTGLSERAIRYAFREIEASGHAVPEARPGKSTVWRFPAVDAVQAETPAPGAPLHLVHPSQATPAPGAPRHQVPPSNERRAARRAPTPAPGAPTPAPGAPEPLKEPVVRTRALTVEQVAQLPPNDVLRCPNLPARRNAWCHADCPLCHGMGHVHVEQLLERGAL